MRLANQHFETLRRQPYVSAARSSLTTRIPKGATSTSRNPQPRQWTRQPRNACPKSTTRYWSPSSTVTHAVRATSLHCGTAGTSLRRRALTTRCREICRSIPVHRPKCTPAKTGTLLPPASLNLWGPSTRCSFPAAPLESNPWLQPPTWGRAAAPTLRLVGAGGQDWGRPQRQPCSAASQPQRELQAHAWASTRVVDGVASAWQPQRQLEPGQSTHWHEEVEGTFMKVS